MITADDIRSLEERDEWGGWGYLGSSDRTPVEDAKLAQAATKSGLSLDDVFLWANSTYGRHFADNAPQSIRAYRAELDRWLPSLRAETEKEEA